ncbi:MAG TPA: hypothetical protein PLY36_13780 [Spirochaetota bacterium]|nr:hypothetical protein [Spirochaetota bacterium]
MKKILTICAALLQLFIFNPLYSAVYEASTLHNSVSRSETVQDLYIKRWDILKEKNFYFDIYGKLNWVFGFDVNTINAGTGQTEPTDLRLTRTYGSMTLAIPFGGGEEAGTLKDFVIALTATGFHYGLTKKIDIDRGDAGSESVTDYKHSQFFDDIYAFSILYRPFITFHGGLIYNNEYVPEEDGTMDYFNPVESYQKKFFAVELYKFMAFSMNIAGGKPESTKAEIGLNPIIGFIKDVSNIYYPVVHVGYERTTAYNDKPYDAVWVENPKTSLTDYTRDTATLNVFSLKVNQRLSQNFTAEGFLGAQYITEDLYSKTDDKKINVSTAKEWYLLLSFDPVTAPNEAKLKAYTGMSWYWDPAIAVHRDNPGKGNAVYGWIIGVDADFVFIGADFKAEYNFSSELKKLIEASDKWAVEGSLFFRI